MTLFKKRILLVLIFILCVVNLFSQVDMDTSERTRSRENYQKSEELYFQGEYEAARALVDLCIEEIEVEKKNYPTNIVSKIYLLKAIISYAFRQEGFREELEEYILKAVKLDLEIEIGDASKVPPFIIDLFKKIRADYLSKYSRNSRKHNLGLMITLVSEPAVLENIFLLQPGIHYAFNLNKNISLVFDVRFPINWPIWESVRAQCGAIWYPSFSVEDIVFGLSAYYLFAMENFSDFTHSISICGHGEIIWRNGLGLAAEVEIVRTDLIIGFNNSDTPEEESYEAIYFIPDKLRLLFANLNVYLFFTF